MSKITFTKTDSNNGDFQKLVALLDDYLKEINGENHSFFSKFNTIDTLSHVLVAYSDGKPVGCGAFKPFSEKEAEIKRMFVLEEFRGQGLGRKILKNLEYWAEESNFDFCILETSKDMPNAVKLYQKAGYSSIQNYGQYKDVESSVCMKKWVSEI